MLRNYNELMVEKSNIFTGRERVEMTSATALVRRSSAGRRIVPSSLILQPRSCNCLDHTCMYAIAQRLKACCASFGQLHCIRQALKA